MPQAKTTWCQPQYKEKVLSAKEVFVQTPGESND